MRHPAKFAFAAAALTAAAVGCGSAATAPRPSVPVPVPAPRVLAEGKRVFAASCSVCHGLSGSESAPRQGGDLAGFRMSEAQLESETRIMPMRRRLTAAEIRAVSLYVLGVQRAHATRHVAR
jgi:mono/diheme cytochrome c family protein